MACAKLDLDPAVGSIYLQCLQLIPMMGALCLGEPVRRVKVAQAMSEEGRRWWHALW